MVPKWIKSKNEEFQTTGHGAYALLRAPVERLEKINGQLKDTRKESKNKNEHLNKKMQAQEEEPQEYYEKSGKLEELVEVMKEAETKTECLLQQGQQNLERPMNKRKTHLEMRKRQMQMEM